MLSDPASQGAEITQLLFVVLHWRR